MFSPKNNPPLTPTTAATRIQTSYRQHLIRKRLQVPLPEKFRHLTTPNTFFAKNLKPNDGFYIARAGKESLLATLNARNTSLLEHYFQRGTDPRGMIRQAYFCNEAQARASLELVDFVGDVQSAIHELIGSPVIPGKRVRCFSILKDPNVFTQEACQYLIPYLRNAYPLSDKDFLYLKQALFKLPRADCIFATVDYNERLKLALLKIILERCLEVINEGDTSILLYLLILQAKALFVSPTNPYCAQLEILTKRITREYFDDIIVNSINNEQIKVVLSNVFDRLIRDYPFVKTCTINSSLHLQLVGSGTSLYSMTDSPNKDQVAQVIVPINILSLCQSLAYGHENHINYFLAYGVQRAEDIAAASKANGRIINAQDKHIAGLTKAHNAAAGPWAVREHDVSHWRRMGSVPMGFRKGMLDVARWIEEVTNFNLSKLTYRLYDGDILSFEMLDQHQSERYSLDYNIKAFATFYVTQCARLQLSDSVAFEYFLIIAFSILADNNWMTKTFAHCHDKNKEESLLKLLGALYQSSLLSPLTAYEQAKLNAKEFNPDLSTHANILQLLIKDLILNGILCKPAVDILMFIDKTTPIIGWTRNNGLKFLHLEKTIFFRDICNGNFANVLTLLLNQIQNDVIYAGVKERLPTFNLADPIENNLFQELTIALTAVHAPMRLSL